MTIRNRKSHSMVTEVSKHDPGSPKCTARHSVNDFPNICLLMFLYILQGIPLGLAAAIPYLLQSNPNTASYQLQATFSVVLWPFSLKLAWAPLVDSIYCSRIGRRKTWLVPIQYAIGIDLLVLASHVNNWLGRDPNNPWSALGITHPVDITRLTIAFFGLTFLAATQDIAVDGWALTMLSKKNLGWASTCNSVGQTLGYVIAFILFLCLESPEISNTYLRRVPIEGKGLITFSGFLYFWGIVFLVSTTIVGLVKRENLHITTRQLSSPRLQSLARNTQSSHGNLNYILVSQDENEILNDPIYAIDSNEVQLRNFPSLTNSKGAVDISSGSRQFQAIEILSDNDCSSRFENTNEELSLLDTYRVMFGVIRLKPILQYILIIFVVKVCFSAPDSITGLKLIEYGLSKERLAFLGVLLLPLQAILPLLVTRWTNGPRPLGTFSMVILPRLLIASLTIPLVYYTPSFRIADPMLNKTGNFNPLWPTSANSTQHSFLWSFYAILLSQFAVYSVFTNIMFVSQMAFHAKISDAAVGGTYMTLLNTATNLASSLPSTMFLSLVEPLTKRQCTHADPIQAGLANYHQHYGGHTNQTTIDNLTENHLLELGHAWLTTNATCRIGAGLKACELAGGHCVTMLDGFYLEVGFCLLIGLILFPILILPMAKRLDALPSSAYSYRLTKRVNCN